VGRKTNSSFDAEIEAAYRQRRGAVRSVASRVGPADSADLVQDAYLRTIEAGRRSDIGAAFAFLLRVARNGAIDRFRHRARWAKLAAGADEAVDRPDPAPDPERSLIARDRLRRALASIETMPERRREVFLLHRIEGLTYLQIARQLGISPKTVEYHLAAAMAQLSRDVDAAEDSE
jgi:RNA polymerase sigma factor (sigma-70 family)